MTISIIDDNETNLYILGECLLSKYSQNYILKYSSAIDYLNDEFKQVDSIVITDIMMPKINGFELCKIIKDKNPEIRVIGITAMTNDEFIEEKRVESNMEIVFFKPYSMSMLLEYLEKPFSEK